MNPISITVTGRLGDDPRQFTTRSGTDGVELRLAIEIPARGAGDSARTCPAVWRMRSLRMRQLAAARGRDLEASPEDRLRGQGGAAYFDGVAATAWILDERAESPITCTRQREPTAKVMKTERVHALDVAEQTRRPRVWPIVGYLCPMVRVSMPLSHG